MKAVSFNKFLFSLNDIYLSHKGDVLIITSTEEEALLFLSQIKFFAPSVEALYLPSLDSLPYDRVSPSSKILSERAYCLARLGAEKAPKVLITNARNIIGKYPPPEEVMNCYKLLKVGDNIKVTEIEKFLLASSYQRTSCAIDPGDFARRGDILDIVLFSGEAYRVNFGWDQVESIRIYDTDTQISQDKRPALELYAASELILNESNIENYKNNFLKLFGVNNAKERYFEDVVNGIRIDGIESFMPIFYKEEISLLKYLSDPKIFFSNFAEQSLLQFVNDYKDFYEARQNAKKYDNNFYPVLPINLLIFNYEIILNKITDRTKIENIPEKEFSYINNFFHLLQVEKKPAVNMLIDLCKENFTKTSIICASSKSRADQIQNLLSQYDVNFAQVNDISFAKPKIINIGIANIERGFISQDYIIVSDSELIGERKQVQKTSKAKLKNIFKEIESFNEGDLVVHIDHGIGRYEAIEQVVVDKIKHDCLKIIYAKGDRLFIPVENIGVLKRYGSNDVELDHLGGVSWQKRKSKLKNRLGEIADNLIKIAAQRATKTIRPISKADTDYLLFCKKFPYLETEDQLRAINDIIEDLESQKPMDRLICGDVGFGKTEVAMRAAYIVAANKLEKMQVAIIVPTTILARQHYANFIERFYGFGVKIAQISRFISNAEIAKTKQRIQEGEVDIVIGTHGLLADGIKFKNLGLMIVDEEQHFGVSQKEKLKNLRDIVHCLTLSATPIPRTLQMSLLGIKDLSLIATPPIDRLSIKTSLISYDEVIIREALLREKFRGGKSFFVCPRISDLADIASNLKEIVPELKFKIINGQMPAKQIDDIMTEFYEGKIDILLSTAIVESGLDVPSANTMIIYKAEMFGLSQLYQLRGRVGRAKVRGCSYLVLDRKKMPTKSALKRLSIMESLDSLGAGFSIASHDMDLRGFGNLIGDEQSGHIKEIGIELYQEMLEEEISKAKNEDIIVNELPNVKMNIPIYIPEDYIKDQDLRLGIYRRIGDIKIAEEVEDFKIELLDRFGEIPLSVTNLLEIMHLKVLASKIGIASMEVGTGGINAQFTSEAIADKILQFVAKYPRNTRIKPENRLVLIKEMKVGEFLKEAQLFISNFK